MALLPSCLPLASLLKESGTHPSNLSKIVLRKALDLLRSPPQEDEEHSRYESVLQCMETLLFLLPQVADENKQEVSVNVICDMFDPYLTALSSSSYFIAATNQMRLAAHVRAFGSVLGIILQHTAAGSMLDDDLLGKFAELFCSFCTQRSCEIPEELHRKMAVNPVAAITILDHMLRTADANEIEGRGISLSSLYDSVMQLLQDSDLQTCYRLITSILPQFVTYSHPERVENMWDFIVQVRGKKLHVNSHDSDLILTILCCFSNLFISYNHTSPFSSRLPSFLCDRKKPAYDLRKEAVFWNIVQEGLTSPDPISRKRCTYLVQCVLASVRGALGEGGWEGVATDDGVFWWSGECNRELGTVWDSLMLIIETMEEKQIHIVKPVKRYLTDIISATTALCSNGRSLLHVSWLMVALSRVFEHTEAKTIICWGVQECLSMNLEGSPILLEENWKFVFGRLLGVLNISMIYGWDQNGRYNAPPSVAKNLASFLQRFVKSLETEKKGIFLSQLLAAIDGMNFVEVPLVFVSYSLSLLPTAPLLGASALAHIRSIILTGMLTHRPALRAATQSFLLTTVCKLADSKNLSFEAVIQTLGIFRETECFVIGTNSWNQAYSFFAHFCLSKEEEEGGVFRYLERCVRNCLKEGKERDPSLPSVSHLARAIVLLSDGEGRSTREPLRVISHGTMGVKEATSALFCPALELVVGAQKRPYLPVATVRASLQLIKTALELVLRENTQRGASVVVSALASCCDEGKLADILHYVVEQVFLGRLSKDDGGAPCLDHLSFHLEVLDCFHCFVAVCFGSLLKPSDGLSVTSCAVRACLVLRGILVGETVPLSASFLGAVSMLHWACSTSPSRISNTALSHMANFPVHLTLVKEETCPQHPTADVSTATPTPAAMERMDWGPLVTHCYSSYWQCLAFYLKWADVSAMDTRPAEEGERVVIGSTDAMSVADCCLDNLDVAAFSLGVIIESMADLLPKWIKTAGVAMVISCATTMWPLVLELKNHQQPFWRALRAYLSFVFHPTVLLSHAHSQSDILDLQWKCANDLLELGEAKTNVYNIFVDHMLEVWESEARRCGLHPASTIAAASVASGDCKTPLAGAVESLFRSLEAHNEMLVQMCVFGPVYKKNIRNVEEVELFLESLQEDSPDAIKFTRCVEGNSNVRVKVLIFLLKLAKSCSGSDQATASLCSHFLHRLVCQLLQQVEDITAAKRQYFINSLTHRTKLRLAQTLLIVSQFVTENTGDVICKRLLLTLQSDNQLSVRYMMEWSVVNMLTKFPSLLGPHIYQLLAHNADLRLSRMCSVLTIAMHLGCGMHHSDTKIAYYQRVLPYVLQWTTCHHNVARLYAQHTLFCMWDDCKRCKLAEMLSSFHYVEGLVDFMRSAGDGGKFSQKIEKNIFFSKVRATLDRNIETVFHVLPILSGVTFEEAIPLKCFQSALSAGTRCCDASAASCVGVELCCSNLELLGALERHWEMLPCEDDGSHTRSLAHHFKSESTPSNIPAVPCNKTSPVPCNTQYPSQGDDVQKKISLLSNTQAVVKELFPHSVDYSTPNSGGTQPGGKGGDYDSGSSESQMSTSGLIVVASLVSKTPNQGGLCRTCEVFSVQGLALSNLNVIEDKQFLGLSVTSEQWLPLQEVKLGGLRDYLLSMRQSGYSIVGLEQTMRSRCASSYQFKRETVLVLGNEREGIPAGVIALLDDCIEIPQFGTIRSLNVHVSASLLIWEYTRQHLV